MHLLCLCLLISKYHGVLCVYRGKHYKMQQYFTDRTKAYKQRTYLEACVRATSKYCIKHYIVLIASFESLCLLLVSTGVSNSNSQPALSMFVPIISSSKRQPKPTAWHKCFYRPDDLLEYLPLESTSNNRNN